MGTDKIALSLTEFLDAVNTAEPKESGQEDEPLEISPAGFGASDDTLICLAPASGDEIVVTNMPVIARVQQFVPGSARGSVEVGEIGSKGKANVATPVGRKQGSLTQVITKNGSLAYQLYRIASRGMDEDLLPQGVMWENLDHSIFDKPFGIVVVYLEVDPDSGEVSAYQYEWLRNVLIGRVSPPVQYGDVTLAHEVTLAWADTLPVPVD